ncbi:MAG: DNA cytosine methyltransferase [Acidobacteriaceae bacterium]
MSKPTCGSLFSGAGLGDIGIERAGFEHRWFVEIDPWCRNVLEKRWPGVPKHGDIQEVTGHELEAVDLITAGFPCNDISAAGRGEGIFGPKSRLWFDALRIIRVVRPRYILVENSPNLLGRGMREVLGGLAESWYDAEWQIVGADDVGAPHKRKRLWIVAYAAGVE